jgi:hypothetical protein
MKVSFNTTQPNYKLPSFSAANKKKKSDAYLEYVYTKEEIRKAKTKKAISECAWVAFGVSILYFAMKKNIKINKIKASEYKRIQNAKIPFPGVDWENLAKFRDGV